MITKEIVNCSPTLFPTLFFCFGLAQIKHLSTGTEKTEEIAHSASIVYFWLYRTILNPEAGGLSYRERGMRTGTHCTGMKGARGPGCTCSLSHKNTDTHKGRLDVHRREAVCLMPVFFCQRCSGGGEGVGEGGREGVWAEDESRRRAMPIKNDSRRRSRQKREWIEARILTGETQGALDGEEMWQGTRAPWSRTSRNWGNKKWRSDGGDREERVTRWGAGSKNKKRQTEGEVQGGRKICKGKRVTAFRRDKSYKRTALKRPRTR